MTVPAPLVSVVVPVYNDLYGIKATLDAVLKQTYPDDRYEVIVADNGSTDDTREGVRSYSEQYPEQVTLVVEDEIQSPAAARNRGIEHASGSVFAFIDADMTVDATWLQSAVESLVDGGHDYMGCAVETCIEDGHETLAAKYDELFAFPVERYVRELKFAGTGCLVVRREVFDAVGPFDTRLVFGADKEFGTRVHNAGFDLHFEPGVTMYHPARSSLVEHMNKGFRIGRGSIHLHDVYPDRFDAGSPFDLRKYLPLNPVWFRSQVRNESVRSKRETIGLYLVGCLQKFSRTAGSLYEYFGEVSTTRSD